MLKSGDSSLAQRLSGDFDKMDEVVLPRAPSSLEFTNPIGESMVVEESRSKDRGVPTGKRNFTTQEDINGDISSGKVFREDAASHSLFSTITSVKVQEKVKELQLGMHKHAEGQQHHMTDEMNYEVCAAAVHRAQTHCQRRNAAEFNIPFRPQDILGKGILYQGEYLVDGLEPMRLQSLEMAKAEARFHPPTPRCLAGSPRAAIARVVPNAGGRPVAERGVLL